MIGGEVMLVVGLAAPEQLTLGASTLLKYSQNPVHTIVRAS
jgi:hypothetical protein